MTYIEVPAGLSPYHPDKVMANRMIALRAWNYALQSEGKAEKNTAEQFSSLEKTIDGGDSGDAFRFSGTYGPNLMTEVKRYADIGAIIATEYSFDVIHAHDWMTFLAGI